jgi:hypothetical protein
VSEFSGAKFLLQTAPAGGAASADRRHGIYSRVGRSQCDNVESIPGNCYLFVRIFHAAEERKDMTALIKPSGDRTKLVVKAKHNVDRKALRAEINERYEHTLRRLGK